MQQTARYSAPCNNSLVCFVGGIGRVETDADGSWPIV